MPPSPWQTIGSTLPGQIHSSAHEGHGIAGVAAAVVPHPDAPEIATQRESEDLVRSHRIEAKQGGRAAQSSCRRALTEPFAFSGELADATHARVVGEEPVPDPSQRIEASELARSRAFPAEGAHMRPIETEDADLVVYGVRHEDGLIGAEGDGANLAELLGSLPFGQRFRSNRDDRGKLPSGRCAGVGDVDDATNGYRTWWRGRRGQKWSSAGHRAGANAAATRSATLAGSTGRGCGGMSISCRARWGAVGIPKSACTALRRKVGLRQRSGVGRDRGGKQSSHCHWEAGGARVRETGGKQFSRGFGRGARSHPSLERECFTSRRRTRVA